MTDREAFHRAIRANPDDLTAQLVFADWLDEFSDQSTDRVRAEFVRCAGGRAHKIFHPKRGAWLDANIGKLFPTILDANREAQQEEKGMVHAYKPTEFDRNGRHVTVAAAVPWEIGRVARMWGRPAPFTRRVWGRLTYTHGFASACTFRDERDYLALGGLVLADEPCVRFRPSDTRGASRHAHGWHVYRQDWDHLWDLIPRDDVTDSANLHGREIWLLFGPHNTEWGRRGSHTREQSRRIGKHLAAQAIGRAMDAWAAANVGKQLVT